MDHTERVLNLSLKFADVVGNIYEANGYKILPIYHPSPISPKSYLGNVSIFEKILKEGIKICLF